MSVHLRFGRLLLVLVPALAALSIGTTSASAVGCFPVVTSSGVMTAAQPANTPPATENVDATGCDIGLYYNSGTQLLKDTNVFGATSYGVLSEGSANTTITFSSVYDIGDKPHNGVQRGIAVVYRGGATGQLDHSQLFDYQKGGVVIRGTGTNVTVVGNVVRGLGPVDFIAQNGVQVSDGAAATVNDNVIEDHQYTGCTKADAKATGCIYFVSTGILLVGVDPAVVDTKNNTYRNNDVNLLNASNQ